MIISSSQVQRTVALYAKAQKKAPKGKAKAPVGAGDKVSLSTSSREVKQVIEQLHKLPDVRTGLVCQLREEIRGGRYNPKGEDVAEKILGRLTVDRLV
jgi:flagellar biosynthesis anti-sigma factor FlgM